MYSVPLCSIYRWLCLSFPARVSPAHFSLGLQLHPKKQRVADVNLSKEDLFGWVIERSTVLTPVSISPLFSSSGPWSPPRPLPRFLPLPRFMPRPPLPRPRPRPPLPPEQMKLQITLLLLFNRQYLCF